MTFKDHGYYGYAYIGARLTQAVVLLPVIGMAGNFIALITKSKHSPPSELVTTLVFTSISFLWVILSVTAYDDAHIPYLATFGVDTAMLIPFIVLAVIIGQPLSLTTCSDLPPNVSNVALPISSLAGQPVSYVVFSGAGQSTCNQLMAVWGFIIVLCILFATSAISALFLFLGKRRARGTGNAASFMDGPSGAGKFPGGGRYPNDSEVEMVSGKGSFSPNPSISSDGSRMPPRAIGGPPRGPPAQLNSQMPGSDGEIVGPRGRLYGLAGNPAQLNGGANNGPMNPPGPPPS